MVNWSYIKGRINYSNYIYVHVMCLYTVTDMAKANIAFELEAAHFSRTKSQIVKAFFMATRSHFPLEAWTWFSFPRGIIAVTGSLLKN